uniref:peroxisome assembly protein 26 n=1 Tax=Pristiophorus japonicus TaxID=55135 RepID=UPI00398F031B
MRRGGPVWTGQRATSGTEMEVEVWRGSGSGGPGPGSGSPSPAPSPPGLAALARAAELLQVRRDFRGALAACRCGLEPGGAEPEGSGSSTLRPGDLKSSLCIMGIQALAELNQWDQVLSWVLELYQIPEKIPAKILQMCIILYSKVGEPGRMQQAVSSWLQCWASPSGVGCGAGLVLELYLLHVLLPLGLYAEAEELILDTAVLTEQQRGAALRVVAQRRPEQLEQEQAGSRSQVTEGCSQNRHPARNALFQLIQQVLGLSWRCLHLVSLRKLILAVFLAYLLIVRLDPASPAALSWLASLQHFLRLMWNTMFAPYYKTRIGK